ncbi:MAG: DUF3617 domain-containing protein [Acidobacteriaceae bacterium]
MFLNRFQPCVFLLALCAVAVAAAQAVPPTTPPPVKMGLWETTLTTHMSGFQLPPEVVERLKQMGRPVPGGAHTMVTQGCLTPDEWRKDMEDMNKPRNSDCTITKHGDDVRSLSFDISCKQGNSTISGDWEMHVIDNEHGHGSGHMTSDQAGPNGQSIVVDSTMDSRYLGADCGDVKPGATKIIKQ